MKKFSTLGLFQQIDGASLAVFRMMYASCSLAFVYHYLVYSSLDPIYHTKGLHFYYYGFHWISPLSNMGMYWLVFTLGICSLLMLTGTFYRLATACFVLGFTYFFLCDAVLYFNHYYLHILLGILLLVTPANRVWSIDAILFRDTLIKTIPVWALWIFLVQIEIVYIIAGLVKINSDWLAGEPLRAWFQRRTSDPLLGQFFSWPWAPMVSSYAVIALHVFGAPLLLMKKTRFFILFCYIIFHLLNAHMFSIGIFPWQMIAATLLFFEPDWPRRLMFRLKNCCQKSCSVYSHRYSAVKLPTPYKRYTLISFCCLWIMLQILIPFRHWLYPGNVLWTGEGLRFSWMMMISYMSAMIDMQVTDNQSGQTWSINIDDYINPIRLYRVWHFPDLLLQLAHQIGESYQRSGHKDVSVTMDIQMSLNGRQFVPYLDPQRDLMQVKDRLWPSADWLYPLNEVTKNK